MEEIKLMYFYDDKKVYTEQCEIYDGGELPKNATLVAPSGYEPITYDEATKTWSGVSEEEYLKEHPQPEPEPTTQDKMNAMLLKQILELKKETQGDK